MKLLSKLILAASMVVTTQANAEVVTLDFENISPEYPFNLSSNIQVHNFYNGGTSSVGTSGTDYGVSFSDNALAVCLTEPGVAWEDCAFASRGGQGDPNSGRGGLFFAEGDSIFMNVEAGFNSEISFFYLAESASVSIFDGLDGTGTLLASSNFGGEPAGCGPTYSGACPMFFSEVLFDGTARSVSFTGVAYGMGLDDIALTLGEATQPVNGVPISGTASLLGLGFVLVTRARRKAQG